MPTDMHNEEERHTTHVVDAPAAPEPDDVAEDGQTGLEADRGVLDAQDEHPKN